MKKSFVFVVMLLVMLFTSIVLAESKDYLKEYSDVSTWHWAYETIQKLSSRGIISGYPDGSFKPSNTITRAEATKILMIALNPNYVFSYDIYVCEDVPGSHWASRYIINGDLYVKPYEDGTFKPEKNITRLEFANAIAESLEFANLAIKPDANTENIILKDIGNLDEESIENIKFLIKLGIVNGYTDGTFRPNNTLTRAEACKMLSLALIYKENGLSDAMSNKDSWYELDPVTGWNQPIQYDKDGNLKYHIHVDDVIHQLYYNGEYFMTPNRNITTMKQEKLYTPDGKEWDIKWFGSKVVEYKVTEDAKHIIMNHYQEKEYIFNTKFIKKEEAISVLKELFPYADFDLAEKEGRMWIFEYIPSTHRNVSQSTVTDCFKTDDGQIWISVESLSTEIWMEEVNGNTQSQIEWFESER